MLESVSLLIHPWTRKVNAHTGTSWIRSITDAAGRPLGFVRMEADFTWFSWLRKTRLAVYETDDASHLMTLTRGLFARWEIVDAENRHVGGLYAQNIVTSDHTRLGRLLTDADGSGIIDDGHSKQRARFSRKEGEMLEVSFAVDPAANPFVRMLVLASILTLDPLPGPDASS